MADNSSKPGRKSQYHEIFCGGGDEMLAEEKAVLAYMVSEGATDAQVAAYYGVSRQSLATWKRENIEFFRVFKDNKKVADDNVEKALYDRAVGYEVIETKVFVDKGEALFVEVVKHIPPDVQAARYWLNNRKPEQWKEQVHNTNENLNKEVAAFDLSGLSDAELELWGKLLQKVTPTE
jgi:hypothetical protein